MCLSVLWPIDEHHRQTHNTASGKSLTVTTPQQAKETGKVISQVLFYAIHTIIYMYYHQRWNLYAQQTCCISSRLSDKLFSISPIFWLPSDCATSSWLLRWTTFFTSDFILLMYRRATVSSSSNFSADTCCILAESFWIKHSSSWPSLTRLDLRDFN